MAFDYQKALDGGFSEDEILNYLTVLTKYNSKGAIEAGANKQDVIKYLSGKVTSPVQQKEEQKGLFKRIVEAPYETLIAKPAVRFGQALAAPIVYGFGDEATKERYRKEIQKDVQAPSPFFGDTVNIEAVKGGVEGLKQIGGEALDIASYLVGGTGTGKVLQTGLKGQFKSAVTEGIKTGFGSSAMGGAGRTLQEGGTVEDAISSGITSGVVGATVGGVTAGVVPAVSALTRGVGKAKDVVQTVAPDITRLPSRVATNIEARVATEQAIKQLKTPTLQNAVRDGINLPDVEFLTAIPKEQKTAVKKLFGFVDNIKSDADKIKVQEAVGAPIVDRLRRAESKASIVGDKLSKEAGKLGAVKREELIPDIISEIQKVPGMKDISVSDYMTGKLDFTNTVISELNPQAQAEIQRIFSSAVKSGSGKSKDLLRKELFEILGGKKKALVNLTATEEQVIDSVRAGLLKTLSKQNPAYRKVSTEYAKLIKPLNDLRKLLKSTGVEDDILNLKAGVLARRLTSNRLSRADITRILRDLDKVAGKKGGVSVETLQNVYNILDRYYELAPSTGYQGQTRAAVESAIDSVGGAVVSGVKSLAGQTQAVRQKALKNVFNELFK